MSQRDIEEVERNDYPENSVGYRKQLSMVSPEFAEPYKSYGSC